MSGFNKVLFLTYFPGFNRLSQIYFQHISDGLMTLPYNKAPKNRGFQTVKKLIHCERKGSGNEAFPEFNPQAEFISAEENPVFLRPDKVQGFPQK